MSRIQSGGMVPLFDRLGLDTKNYDGISNNFLTPNGVEQSVLFELNKLASTRSKLTFNKFVENDLTVLDYGLPDFTGFSAQNDEHRRIVKSAIKKAVEHFEPRLKEVSVSIFSNSSKKHISLFGIDATLLLGNEFQRVSFPLSNTNKSSKFNNNKEMIK